MKNVDGKSVRVKTGEEFQWWDKSFRMSPIVLSIKKQDVEYETGKWRNMRVTTFERIRGVPNAAKLAKEMYDITYEKFINELHMIRQRYEEIKAAGGDMEEVADNKIASIRSEEKSNRRRRRRSTNNSDDSSKKESSSNESTKDEASEEEPPVEKKEEEPVKRRRRRGSD